eukprot:g1017.t1
MASLVAPNHTLHLHNVDESMKPTKVRKLLYYAFTPYGKVVDVVVKRTRRIRGQAWVVFDSVTSATIAKQAMNDFPFGSHGKHLKISFARSKSDAIAKLDGTYRVNSTEHRARNFTTIDQQDNNGIPNTSSMQVETSETDDSATSQNNTGNKLLVQGLDEDVTLPQLQALFGQYEGLTNVRLVSAKGLAFVEFQNEFTAETAKQGLQNLKIRDGVELQISNAAQ